MLSPVTVTFHACSTALAGTDWIASAITSITYLPPSESAYDDFKVMPFSPIKFTAGLFPGATGFE